jgi:hypothetical protein
VYGEVGAVLGVVVEQATADAHAQIDEHVEHEQHQHVSVHETHEHATVVGEAFCFETNRRERGALYLLRRLSRREVLNGGFFWLRLSLVSGPA